MRWMEERGRGFRVGGGVVPIVPAAVLFDLGPLGRFDARPTPRMAYDACDRAAPLVTEQGSVGAGTGATVGKTLGAARAMKGGIGCVTLEANGLRAAGVAAVNALGDVRDAAGRVIAGARGGDGATPTGAAFGNTTLCVVAVDAPLGRVALAQLARAATAALYRRITPCGTTFDGDVVFAVCPVGAPAAEDAALVLRAEALATAALEAAIERAVREAVGRDGVPGLADARA